MDIESRLAKGKESFYSAIKYYTLIISEPIKKVILHEEWTSHDSDTGYYVSIIADSGKVLWEYPSGPATCDERTEYMAFFLSHMFDCPLEDRKMF